MKLDIHRDEYMKINRCLDSIKTDKYESEAYKNEFLKRNKHW